MPSMIKRKIHLFLLPLALYASTCYSSIILSPIPLERGYAKISTVSELDLSTFIIPKEQQKDSIENFCNRVSKEFQRYSWKQAPCEGVEWQANLKTGQGYPLLYTSFGEGVNTTLILGGVHPDELTPIHLAFRFARHLHANPSIYKGKGIRVIIAPLVNPDGFLQKYPTRTNAAHIDLNRNFLTSDWYDQALKSWANKKNTAQRFFPGYFPNSEIETVFQNQLLETFLPSKILSIHAPLGFYDYDGPGDKLTKPLSASEEQARYFVHKVSEKSRNYRIVDYSFYPGSLGNLTGKQRRVPTLTLELETTNPKLVDQYWDKFLPGFLQSIQFAYEWKPASLH